MRIMADDEDSDTKQDDDNIYCQGILCKELPLLQRQYATKVCHHSVCQEKNDKKPLVLCSICDNHNHSGMTASHLRFDLPGDLHRKASIRSINSDSGTEEDTDPVYQFDKKNRTYSSARRFFNITATKNRGKLKKLQSFDDSAKEFFTLQFYDNAEEPLNTEKVPVRKGKSLKESIEGIFHSHDLNFKSHSVFLDSSNTPLPLMFDTFPLRGNTLHVKANNTVEVDARIIGLMNVEVTSQRPKGNDTNKTASLQKERRKTPMFTSAKDLTKSNLTEFLTEYFDLDSIRDKDDLKEADLYLEDKWVYVIEEKPGMLREDKIQQEAIWELLVTEKNHLQTLRVITQVFQTCLILLQRENFLNEVENQKLFSNISEVYEVSRTFWTKYLKPVLDETRVRKEPIKPSQLLDSFAKFEDLFEPYLTNCLKQSSCVEYLKSQKKNELFEEYLSWCENQPQCNRLTLQDLLVKPMQRITKYRLLLKAILQKTRDEEEWLSLDNTINQVERFVVRINTTMRSRQEQQRLEKVLKRIDMYYPVEPVNEEMERIMMDYVNLDLRGKIPGLHEDEQRCIVLEGPMKMTEKHLKLDVHTFLFTDVLVIAKLKRNSDKLRIIRQPFRLNRVMIHPIRETNSFVVIYLNEYQVLVTAFMLQLNAVEFMNWVQTIEKTKHRYLQARAGQGSTLDFYDDEMLTSPNCSASFDISPMAYRRSTINADDSPSSPSIVVTNDMNLRSRSSIVISENSRDSKSEIAGEVAVKRSLSDPKSGGRNRDKRTRARPMSLISTSDRDTASWVLTNEKRHRSGSIPSDISEDSRRSSGIGDSFRSINSDSAIPIREGGVIKPFSSYPEVSNVMKLKAKFEITDCQSPSTEGSDSSISTTSQVIGYTESVSTSQVSSSQTGTTTTNGATSTSRRGATPPDFMENHSTIHEEEEHSSNNSYEKLGDTSSTVRDSNDSLRSSVITVKANEHDNDEESPYENLNLIRSSIKTLTSSNATLTSIRNNLVDVGIQCILSNDDISVPNVEYDSMNDTLCEDPTTLDKVILNSRQDLDLQQDGSSALSKSLEVRSVSVQCTDFIPTPCEWHDVGIQCCSEMCEAGIQCGDFIQLTGVIESESEEGDLSCIDDSPDRDRPSSAPPSQEEVTSSHTPMLNMLIQSRGILKHSYSEANISIVSQLPPEVNISHSRSRSDEPKQLDGGISLRDKHLTAKYDSPGMRALQTLSENLESTIQQRQKFNTKPIVKTYDKNNKIDILPNKSENSTHNQNDVKNHRPESPSPPVAVPQNRSPTELRKLIVHSSTGNLRQNHVDYPGMTRTISEVHPTTIVALRDKSGVKSKYDENKRNTWHDFDSVEALNRMEQTQYVTEGRPDVNSNSKTINRSHSQSTEQLNSPKKQKSFKKPFFKKFSTSNMLGGRDSKANSQSIDHVDHKKQKQPKKEKDRIKKEKKQKEKEEKKRLKEDKTAAKRRSTSLTSSSSSSSKITDVKIESISESSN